MQRFEGHLSNKQLLTALGVLIFLAYVAAIIGAGRRFRVPLESAAKGLDRFMTHSAATPEKPPAELAPR